MAFILSALVGCQSGGQQPAAPHPAASGQPAPEHAAPAAADSDEDAPAAAGPAVLRISELTVDEDRTVRITGTIVTIEGLRMVPPKVIFKVSDSQETVTVLIKKQVSLREGARIELVGRYQEIPSPMYQGPGEPPKQAVFVVERYLDLSN